jgi:dCTP deaminase
MLKTLGERIRNEKEGSSRGRQISNQSSSSRAWILFNGVMIKSDIWIREMSTTKKMIDPFVERQDGKGKISFGLSSYGYDMRVADEYKVFTNVHGTVVDPKNFDSKAFVDIKGSECVVPPNSFALARSLERFTIPRDVLAVCLGKSTYARCGIIINVTPLEPGWEGYLTIEISNTTPLPAKIYSNEGIAQLLFFGGDQLCETSYSDRKGKYMDQVGVVLPRILAAK